LRHAQRTHRPAGRRHLARGCKNAPGRDRLAAWLKHLENRSGAVPDPNDPMATYDFTWIWRELGIENLRR